MREGFVCCQLTLIKALHLDTNTVNCKDASKQIFLDKELLGLTPNFQIKVSVSDLYIPSHHRSAYSIFCCRKICGPDLGNI
jgi:hypothetical protein